MGREDYIPRWEFLGLARTWKIWAVGYYGGERPDYRWLIFAFGPLRFLFKRAKNG